MLSFPLLVILLVLIPNATPCSWMFYIGVYVDLNTNIVLNWVFWVEIMPQ